MFDALTKWQRRFLDMANLVASWSKDPSTKVGAVIADSDNRVVSLGFNGAPRNVDDAFVSREQKLLRTIHAELNALHFARGDVSGCTIYVTHPPCAQCAASIIQRGIKEVVFPKPNADFMSRWAENYAEAVDMFVSADVGVCETNVGEQ